MGKKFYQMDFTASKYLWVSMTVGNDEPFASLPAMGMTETWMSLTICTVI
jgi:hypothetical protein